MSATLFAVPASHPCLAAELMLRHKGIGYRRVDLVAAVHRSLVRALGFSANTVPALRLDGIHLQGTRRIALALDALHPQRPLLPGDPERRAAVEAAEAWGDETLQAIARRLAWNALGRDRSAIESFLEGSNTGIPTPIATRTAPPIIALAARLNRASDDAARRDLVALPALIDRVDALVEDGTIGASEPSVADFQIATSVRLLMTFDDLRPLLEGRPAERHALTIVPRFSGRVPPVFPRAWLPTQGQPG